MGCIVRTGGHNRRTYAPWGALYVKVILTTRTPHGVHCTCGEPNRLKEIPHAQLFANFTFRLSFLLRYRECVGGSLKVSPLPVCKVV